ncbi:MAG: phasin family protein [Xanthomonadales bacterium]|nr:phasin family protein [Xanthomonadales bacterium]
MAEKKLKKLSKKKAEKGESTAQVIKESAGQIWLAGLGAFAKAQEEGGKIFDALVKEGMELESKTRKSTTSRVHEVRGAVEGTVSQVRGRATESWDKLEKIFEERVARALNSLGVPTAKDVKELTKRVEELQKAVDEYNRKESGSSTAKKTTAKKTTKKASASKKKKTAAKKKTSS